MAANTTQTRQALANRASGGLSPAKDIHTLLERMKPEIARALPKHMNAERLARIALTEIRRNPKLLECTPESLLGAVMLSAQLGLEPGPLGHAYLVPYGREVTWILGYKGIIDLAHRSGRLESIEAREVYEMDTFEYAYGLEPRLHHVPSMDPIKGELLAFYGVARFKGGGYYFTVMSIPEIEARRKRSAAAGRNSGPWVTDYVAMGRKTVIRAMAPYLPLSVEIAQAIAQDESVHTEITPDMSDVVDVTGYQVKDDAPDEYPADVDTTTGEMFSDDND